MGLAERWVEPSAQLHNSAYAGHPLYHITCTQPDTYALPPAPSTQPELMLGACPLSPLASPAPGASAAICLLSVHTPAIMRL